MPRFKGVRVLVTDEGGNPRPEYGTQALGRANTVTCYIESIDGMQFRIAAKADPGLLAEHYSAEGPASDEPDPGHPKTLCTGKNEEQQGPANSNGIGSLPFDLLVSVYLDGRAKAERRGTIFLSHPYFMVASRQQIVLASRWVQNKQGDILQRHWEFKETGIETRLDRLLINGKGFADSEVDEQDEADLLKAMGTIGVEETEEPNQVGQITVVVQRVITEAIRNKRNYKAEYQTSDDAGDAEDARVEDVAYQEGINHTAGLGPSVGHISRDEPVLVSVFRPFADDKTPYAIFKFYYRPEVVLQKFNFKDFPSASSTPGKGVAPGKRRMNSDLSSLTPLSILYPSSSSKNGLSRDGLSSSSQSPSNGTAQRQRKGRPKARTTISNEEFEETLSKQRDWSQEFKARHSIEQYTDYEHASDESDFETKVSEGYSSSGPKATPAISINPKASTTPKAATRLGEIETRKRHNGSYEGPGLPEQATPEHDADTNKKPARKRRHTVVDDACPGPSSVT